MRFLLIVSVVLSFFVAKLSADEATRATRTPSKDTDETASRFVRECVAIAPGEETFPATFVIGVESPGKNEIARKEITLTSPFRISRYEVTQELYKAVTGTNPSRWQGPRNSVESITWNDAVAFCRKLTESLRAKKLIGDSEVVRLPTSVEWEYCCRAGTSTRYHFGDEVGHDGKTDILDDYAWHTGNAAGNDPAVGVLKPNDWGLSDCHGYLWEFTSDEVPQTAKGDKSKCIIRGGSWRDHHSLLSSSTYLSILQGTMSDGIGLRCVIAQDTAIKKTPQQ